MARKRPPDKRKPPEGKISPDTLEPLAEFFGEIFFNLMAGMIKADQVEADFAKIREGARKLTEEEMRRMTNLAGKYYAEHLPGNPSREKVAILKREALEYALETNEK